MAEIKVKDSDGTYYTAPGTAITSIPVFGKNGASFTSSNLATSTVSPTYTYIPNIYYKSSPNYYISNISAELIKNLYRSKTIYINGSATPLLYRIPAKLYVGFVTGRGGNDGSNGKSFKDTRVGGGGGGAGCALFWITVPNNADVSVSSTTDSSAGTATFKISDNNSSNSVEFTAYPGHNGGNGVSSAFGDGRPGSGPGSGWGSNGGGGGGGYGHAIVKFQLDGTWYQASSLNSTSNGKDDKDFTTKVGPISFACRLQCGSAGGNGSNWGHYSNAPENIFTMSSALKNYMGISEDVSWRRQDGKGGASIAPGVDGNYYGSRGQSQYSYYKVYDY